MRCDRLTPVIFRASGSKFRVPVRAISARDSTHDRQQAQSRENAKRAACCLLLRVDRGISKRPLQASRIAPDRRPHRFRLLPFSQPLTRSTAPRIHPLETHPPPHQKSAPTTSPQTKDPQRALDLHTHRNHRITIVLSSLPEPPNPCTFTPSAAPSMPQNPP